MVYTPTFINPDAYSDRRVHHIDMYGAMVVSWVNLDPYDNHSI